MANTLKIKRRAAGGGAGAPATLAVGELAYNEDSGALYIGTSTPGVVQVNGGGIPANISTLSGLTLGTNYVITGATGSTFDSLQLTANTFLGRASTGTIAAKVMSDDAFAFNAAANNAAMRAALGITDFGIGSTASSLLADFDDAAVLSGIYSVTTGTIGTLPMAATAGVCIHRVAATLGLQIFLAAASERMFWRSRVTSVWGVWHEVTAVGDIGVTLQAWSTKLDSLVSLPATANDVVVGNGASGYQGLAIAVNQFPARSSAGAMAAKPISDNALGFLNNGTYAGDVTFSAKIIATGGTIGTTSLKQHTIPDVASDTLAILGTAQTFTGNKTFNGTTTFGSTATFNGNITVAGTLTVTFGSRIDANAGLALGAPLVISQAAPASKAAGSTAAATELRAGFLQYTGALGNLTMPTGTLLDALLNVNGVGTDQGIDFVVLNTGSGVCTLATAAGITLVGAMTVANGASQRFRARRTGANAYSIYRF